MTSLFRRALPVAAMATLLLPILLGLNPHYSSAQSTDELTAEEILTASSRRLAETPTVRFDLSIDGDTFVDDGESIRLLEAEGDLVRPERVRTKFKVKLMGTVTVTIELIIIGDDVWSTDLITGDWGKAPTEFSYDPSILFDNQNGIGPVMDSVESPQRLDDEEIDDRSVFHVRADVDQTIIGDLTSHTMTGSPVAVDLWIDQETFDLRRARLAEPPSDDRDNPATWTLDLTDQGENITIDPPD